MGKLDESILYDALKHENIQDHVDLEDEDKEFLDNLSKRKTNITFKCQRNNFFRDISCYIVESYTKRA